MSAAFDGARLKALFNAAALKLAVAESMTCGGLQQRIGRIHGASTFFFGGLTAYDRPQKVAHLGVDDAEAEKTNCVSPGIAGQMARGVCVLFNADVGVGTTGYAEPHEKGDAPHAYAYWAIAQREGAFPKVVASGRIDCPGLDRAAAQDRVADDVLAELLQLAERWRT